MRVQRRAPALRALHPALTLAGTVLATIAVSASGDLFDEIYRLGQQRNANLRTLTAGFTETTTSTLLTRPMTARGTIYVERPARIALKYSEPDPRTIIIDGDRLTIVWPSRGVRQTRDIGAAQKRVQNYFVDSSPGELRRHFRISARERSATGAYAIAMIPTRKQIKEGLSRLELTIDRASLLLTSMEMEFPNGDTKVMTFADVRSNVPIDPLLFRPDAGR